MKRSKTFKVAAVLLVGFLLHTFIAPAFANDRTSIRRGLPGRRISGGSRSPSTACLLNSSNLEENQTVVALAPENNLSRTVTPHPTFWFALPAVNTNRSLEFFIVNQDEEVIYQQTLQPSGKADLVAIAMPETGPKLEAGQTYKWHLSVVCDRDSRATDLVVWGWIERASIQSLTLQQVSQDEDATRLALYENLNAWNDTLTALFNLYSDRTVDNLPTSDIEAKWTTLLASQNLLGSQNLEQLLTALPSTLPNLSTKPNHEDALSQS